MSERATDAKTQKPEERRSLAEWAIYSLYLPPIMLGVLMLYYFIKGLFGL